MLIWSHGLFYNRYTVTKQIYLEQELHKYLFQNFIMKMQITSILGKYSTKIGISVKGFTFTFPNLSDSLKTLIGSSQDLIIKDTNTEQTSSAPTQNSLFPEEKVIEDSIKNYKNTPIKYYINETYFLYDKSDLIKETFIIALNKKNINLWFN